jgi:hypothetical protein
MRAFVFPIVAVKMIGLDDDVDVAMLKPRRSNMGAQVITLSNAEKYDERQEF